MFFRLYELIVIDLCCKIIRQIPGSGFYILAMHRMMKGALSGLRLLKATESPLKI